VYEPYFGAKKQSEKLLGKIFGPLLCLGKDAPKNAAKNCSSWLQTG